MKKGRRCNRKRKGKTVLAVEGSDDTGAAKKAKADDPGKEIARCAACRALAAADKPGGSDKQYCKIHRAPRATTSRTVDKSSCLLRSKKLSMRGGTRRRAKMALKGPARSVAAKEVRSGPRQEAGRR